MARVAFYYDLGSPYAYLTAERLGSLLPDPVQWRPLALGGIFKATGRSSWGLAGPESRESGMHEVERRAADYGLPPVRWPEPWPTNYLMAMRAATFAFSVGLGHQFTLQAFRNAFQHGRDLSIAGEVLDTADEAGLDRADVEAATQDPGIKSALHAATDSAYELGVIGVPTIAVDAELFWGDDRVEDAAAHLRETAAG